MAPRARQGSKRNGRQRSGKQAARGARQRGGEALEQGKVLLESEAVELRGSAEGKVEGAKEALREGAERVGGLAREAQATALGAGQSALDIVKRNPIPTALAGVGAACTGVGLVWLIAGRRGAARGNGAPSSVAEAMADAIEQSEESRPVGQAAQEALARATTGTQRVARRAQSSIGKAAQVAADRTQRVARDAHAEGQLLGEAAERRFREHPLAVGAAMLVVGTAIGAALPSTLREGRWLGARRDALVGRAREAARGAARKVERLAKSSAESATKAA